MSQRREELQEQYEDALFALLMDDYIEEEGKRLQEENERLKNDPSAAVPEEARQRCLKTIRRELARMDRRTAGRAALRVLKKTAVVTVICMFLFTTAFAMNPEFRAGTLNLFMEVTEQYTMFGIGKHAEPSGTLPTLFRDGLLLGYRLPEVPEGFAVDDGESGLHQGWIRYVNDDGATLLFTVDQADGQGHLIDTENAQVENIRIHECDGMVVEKRYQFEDGVAIDSVVVVWADMQKGSFITVSSTGMERETVLKLARGVEFLPGNS